MAILGKTRALLTNPEKWTKGSPARDHYKTPYSPDVCFCLLEVIRIYSEGRNYITTESALNQATLELYPARTVNSYTPVTFNDHLLTTHDVLKVIGRLRRRNVYK